MIPTKTYLKIHDSFSKGGEKIIARLVLRVLRGEEHEQRRNR